MKTMQIFSLKFKGQVLKFERVPSASRLTVTDTHAASPCAKKEGMTTWKHWLSKFPLCHTFKDDSGTPHTYSATRGSCTPDDCGDCHPCVAFPLLARPGHRLRFRPVKPVKKEQTIFFWVLAPLKVM